MDKSGLSSPEPVQNNFWDDLPLTITNFVKDILLGRDVARLAARQRKTDSLFYKWANPNCEQLPSLEQILLLIHQTDNWPLI